MITKTKVKKWSKIGLFIILILLNINMVSFFSQSTDKYCGPIVELYGDSMSGGKYPKQEFWAKVNLDKKYWNLKVTPVQYYNGIGTNVCRSHSALGYDNMFRFFLSFITIIFDICVLVFLLAAAWTLIEDKYKELKD